jgi:hypothetical protein
VTLARGATAVAAGAGAGAGGRALTVARLLGDLVAASGGASMLGGGTGVSEAFSADARHGALLALGHVAARAAQRLAAERSAEWEDAVAAAARGEALLTHARAPPSRLSAASLVPAIATAAAQLAAARFDVVREGGAVALAALARAAPLPLPEGDLAAVTRAAAAIRQGAFAAEAAAALPRIAPLRDGAARGAAAAPADEAAAAPLTRAAVVALLLRIMTGADRAAAAVSATRVESGKGATPPASSEADEGGGGGVEASIARVTAALAENESRAAAIETVRSAHGRGTALLEAAAIAAGALAAGEALAPRGGDGASGASGASGAVPPALSRAAEAALESLFCLASNK